MFTVASTAPMLLAVAAKAPASIKMTIINMIVSLAAPLQNKETLSMSLPPLEAKIAMAEVIRNATEIGILLISPVLAKVRIYNKKKTARGSSAHPLGVRVISVLLSIERLILYYLVCKGSCFALV